MRAPLKLYVQWLMVKLSRETVMYWWVVILSILACAHDVRAAAQNAAESESGFLENAKYAYSYESAASLLENVNLTVHGEVGYA